MNKIFVIAGTVQQATEWITQDLEKKSPSNNLLSRTDYVRVDGVDRLRGVQDPHGVFIGTWRERKDIYEIVQTLIYNTLHLNKQLHDIHNSLKPKVRPTPKIVSGYQANIDEAGRLMAQAIDQEVLKNLALKINGGTISQGKANVRG
jgi:hypothetical protein